MVWDNYILEQFQTAVPGGEHDESRYYGPYCTLLHQLFPAPEHFMLVPQYKRPEQSKAVDFTTIFIVRHKCHPCFFLEIKALGHLEKPSDRQAADDQMRERYGKLFDEVEISALYGMSAIGTRVCLYEWDRETRKIEPPAIPKDCNYTMDTAPIDRWNLDILSVEGEKCLRAVVARVKTMCSQI